MPEDLRAPRISCVIPTFNTAQFLGEAIESVLEQTYPLLEILVVDDGSTDRTADVVRSFGTRLVYLARPHLGASAAMNAGIRAACGAYIAFLDADDLWHREKLSRQMDWLAQRGEVDLCFTQYRNFWVSELAEEEKLYEGSFLARPTSGWSVSTLLTRREVFERFGFFEESVEEKHLQLVWALRAARQGAVVDVIPEVLMDRRLHRGNTSRSWTTDEGFFRLLRTWRDFKAKEAEASHEE